MGKTEDRVAAKRAALLSALDEEDARLLAALEDERDQPYIPPYRYDLRHRFPRDRRPSDAPSQS